MNIQAFISLVVALWFSIIIIELLYSLYKKDGIYNIKSSLGNVLRYFFVIIFQQKLSTVQVAIIVGLYAFFNSSIDFNSNILNYISCLLVVDVSYYLYHVIHHTFKPFTLIHFVHHSDRTFNLTTALRNPWLQQLYMPISLVPAIMLGYSFEVTLICYSIVMTYQTIVHSQYIRLPRFFDYVFVTPHNHRIHHDQAVVNQNSNFGGIFSVWDRLFGTYVSDIKEFTPGIKGYSQDNFIMMEVDPIVRYLKTKQKIWNK